MDQTTVDNKTISEAVKPGSHLNANKTVLIFLILNFFSIASLIYFSYYSSKIIILKAADNILLAAAYSGAAILGDEFHDSIKDASSVSEQRHHQNVVDLTKMADKLGVDCIYTMFEGNSGEIVMTSLSTTQKDINAKSYDKFFTTYKMPGEFVSKAFGGDKTHFEEVIDEYGYFRTVVIPMKSKEGKNYLAAADTLMSDINDHLNYVLIIFLSAGLIIFAISGSVFSYLIRKYNQAA